MCFTVIVLREGAEVVDSDAAVVCDDWVGSVESAVVFDESAEVGVSEGVVDTPVSEEGVDVDCSSDVVLLGESVADSDWESLEDVGVVSDEVGVVSPEVFEVANKSARPPVSSAALFCRIVNTSILFLTTTCGPWALWTEDL